MFNAQYCCTFKKMAQKFRCILACLLLPAPLLSVNAIAATAQWNARTPIKAPTANNDNGKRILFDVSHGGTQGNADWVLDGAFSDFADALVTEGYTVEEYRGVDLNSNGRIDFFDDYNIPANVGLNEAIITYDAIAHADVLVLAETNRPFSVSEYLALEQFVQAGKGIFFIADHYDADRNLNTWDATEVFNGYNRSDSSAYDLHTHYGDLRNPKVANAGWLVQNFGIRFRFNAVDYKRGVSGVKAPSDTENLTQGVGPVLMAAGATLAIIDNTKAKGLVYFGANDTPKKWTHANDAGLYFGGMAEGPYVAISKAGLGKAAFIGDSSPIEDATPKYKREDNGTTKKTYPGWSDAGNAARLSINIVNWLATPETYTRFNSYRHRAGIVTPTPMAATEKSDPNSGRPWSKPRGQYQPWKPLTFAKGSYGAPCPVQGCGYTDPGDDNTPNTGTISVAQALVLGKGTRVTVEGRVKSELNGIYALLLSDANDQTTIINVKLEPQQREQFSPVLNRAILGQLIRVTGVRDSYLSGPSIESVSAITIIN